MQATADMGPDTKPVTVIMPVHNAAPFLAAALESVTAQTHRPLELSVYNDASTDDSHKILLEARRTLCAAGIAFVLSGGTDKPLGCGAACNRAVAQSTGTYLCFLDADDVMDAQRVAKQLQCCLSPGPLYNVDGDIVMSPDSPAVLVGCNFSRLPSTATPRYTAWHNRLTARTLMTQRLRECTLAKPTWFMARSVMDRVGPFNEGGRGVPEDLLWFYAHIENGGLLAKVSEPLVVYRRHEGAQSLAVSKDVLWAVRVSALTRQVLCHWPRFTIWSAGRDGRRLYRSLDAEMRARVAAFCDVDEKKIAKGVYSPADGGAPVPIVHYTVARPPLVTCVKLDLHEGFEANVASLGLVEGHDYLHFC